MKKVVLITGVAGFIGSHTAELFLKKGFKVNGIDNFISGSKRNLKNLLLNKDFKFLKLDLKKLDKKIKFINECNFIVHFAGTGDIVPSIEYPKKYIINNFNSTLNLLNVLDAKKVKKFVYAASSSCYGLAKIPTNEKVKIETKYPYAFSKYIGEQLCFHWSNVYNLKVNSIRIFNAYGTRSRTSGAYGAVIGVFLKQKLEKKPFTIVGNGKQKRDFIYVTDVADAFYKATITNLNSRIWNVGAGNPKEINHLIKLLGINKKIYLPKRPGEPFVTFADIKKIKKELKWKPKVSLANGIKDLLQNIDYWKEAPLWNKKKIASVTRLWFKYLK